jgi:ubiquitin
MQKALAIGESGGDDELLVQQIRREMPNARQCPRCSFGPVEHDGCGNLRTHHTQVRNGQSAINNACPTCGHFEASIEQWPHWNGVLSVHAIMQIFVRMIRGNYRILDVELTDTILIVKQKLQDAEGIPPNQMRFIHRGKALQDDSKTLSDYKIKKGDTLTLLMRLRGGHPRA